MLYPHSFIETYWKKQIVMVHELKFCSDTVSDVKDNQFHVLPNEQFLALASRLLIYRHNTKIWSIKWYLNII